MLKYFQKLFSGTEDQSNNPVNLNNIVSFVLDQDGQVKLEIIINDDSEDAAEYLGIFFNYLNKGIYVKDIIKTIQDMEPKDQYGSIFAKKIILAWSDHLHDVSSVDEKEPIVAPTSFSKYLNSKQS